MQKIHLKTKKLKINPKNLSLLAREKNWKGKGTSDNPYIIDDNLEKLTYIKITRVDLFIVIRNISIHRVVLLECKNIKIENCAMSRLKFFGCRNLIVRRNMVMVMNPSYSRNCIVEQNYLPEASYNSLIHYYFERLSGNAPYILVPLLSFLAILFSFLAISVIYQLFLPMDRPFEFMVVRTIWGSIYASFFSLFAFLSIYGLYGVFIEIKWRVRANKIPADRYENNGKVDPRHLENDILEFYGYPRVER